MLFPSGNPFECHEEFFLYLQPLISPKRFDIFFPLTGGCSEGLGAFCFFFKHWETLFYYHVELLSLQPVFPPKISDYSGGLAAFRFFLTCCVWWPGMTINVSVQYNG